MFLLMSFSCQENVAGSWTSCQQDVQIVAPVPKGRCARAASTSTRLHFPAVRRDSWANCSDLVQLVWPLQCANQTWFAAGLCWRPITRDWQGGRWRRVKSWGRKLWLPAVRRTWQAAGKPNGSQVQTKRLSIKLNLWCLISWKQQDLAKLGSTEN